MTNHSYHVSLTWQHDRLGELTSPELNQPLPVATPPNFPKGIEGIWSPEHLYTAAVSSCFMTTFLAIAENSKLEFVSFSCDAEGVLTDADNKFRMSEVVLRPHLVITDEAHLDKAHRILLKSEQACLITRSINATVHLNPMVEVVESATA